MLIVTRSAFVADLKQAGRQAQSPCKIFLFFSLYMQLNDERRQPVAAMEYEENKSRVESERASEREKTRTARNRMLRRFPLLYTVRRLTSRKVLPIRRRIISVFSIFFLLPSSSSSSISLYDNSSLL